MHSNLFVTVISMSLALCSNKIGVRTVTDNHYEPFVIELGVGLTFALCVSEM